MEAWAHAQNIERFKELLRTETEPTRRALLEHLLAEEQARLEQLRPRTPKGV